MLSSTLLLVLVLPASYAIMEDFGLHEVDDEELAFLAQTQA
jgi:hypothetical protein